MSGKRLAPLAVATLVLLALATGCAGRAAKDAAKAEATPAADQAAAKAQAGVGEYKGQPMTPEQLAKFRDAAKSGK